jgi:glutaredoxin
MTQIKEQEFLNIANGKSDGITVLSTPTCTKCASLKQKIENLGNPLNITTYVFEPSDENALQFIQENGFMNVPVTIKSLNGIVCSTNEPSYDDIVEELSL